MADRIDASREESRKVGLSTSAARTTSTRRLALMITTAAIVAIDLGKYKSVACRYTDADAQAVFEDLPHSPRHPAPAAGASARPCGGRRGLRPCRLGLMVGWSDRARQ